MTRRILRSAVLFCAVTLALGAADARADVLYDDTYTLIDLPEDVTSQSGTRPSTVTYKINMRMRFFGDVHEGDAVRVVWKRGSRQIANIRCRLNYYAGNPDGGILPNASIALSDRCWSSESPDLNQHGDMTVEVHYIDDQNETTTRVRTLRFEVARTWRVDRIQNNRPIHSPRYYVIGDDLLGMSYVWLRQPDSSTAPFGDVGFYFWAARDDSFFPEANFRCYRDGERVPELDNSERNNHQSVADWSEQDDAIRRRERTTTMYHYRLFWITPNWRWGTRQEGVDERYSDDRPNLTAVPGEYVCKFRSQGETLREFHFTVADDAIVQHTAQGEGGLTLRPGGVFVETRYPRQNPHEYSFQPAAIRRGTAFGQSWNNTAAIRDMIRAMPPARGSSEPRLPDGVRR